MRVELHCHTKYSGDSILSLELLYLMCRFRKISHIAITEHNNIRGALEFKEYCEKKGNRLHVIIGEEILCDRGEIIGLFLKREVPKGLTPFETIMAIKEQGGVVYIPHPYDEIRSRTVLDEASIRENAHMIDCMEIHNGRNASIRFSEIQEKIARKYSIKHVIGSDAHTFLEIGRNYIITEIEPDDRDSFIKMLESCSFCKKNRLNVAVKATKVVGYVELLKEGEYRTAFKVFMNKIKKIRQRNSN